MAATDEVLFEGTQKLTEGCASDDRVRAGTTIARAPPPPGLLPTVTSLMRLGSIVVVADMMDRLLHSAVSAGHTPHHRCKPVAVHICCGCIVLEATTARFG